MGDEYTEVKRQLDDMINNHFIDIRRNLHDGNSQLFYRLQYDKDSATKDICDNMKNIPLYLKNKEEYIRLVNLLLNTPQFQHLDTELDPDVDSGFIFAIDLILRSARIDRCLKDKQPEHEMRTIQWLNSGRNTGNNERNAVFGLSPDVAKYAASYLNSKVDVGSKGGKYSKRHKKTKRKRNKKYNTKKNRKYNTKKNKK